MTNRETRETKTILDAFTLNHLDNWLENTVREEDRDDLRGKILIFVTEYPDILERSSWSEIRNLIERNAAWGIG